MIQIMILIEKCSQELNVLIGFQIFEISVFDHILIVITIALQSYFSD